MKNVTTDNNTCGVETRLSSDLLFHYTTKLEDRLCQILQHGFRHSLSDKESLPNPNRPWQRMFHCCFCDLLPSDAENHRKSYGTFALVLTKEWGIARQISPVRYIHKESAGVNEVYHSRKNLFRSSVAVVDKHVPELMSDGRIEKKEGVRDPQLGITYLLFSRLLDDGFVPNGDFETAMRNNPRVEAEFSKRADEYSALISSNPDSVHAKYFCRHISTLIRRINELHGELEKRDAFLRAYEENGKVLYDEREWRSVTTIPAKDDFSHIKTMAKAIEDGFLPPEFNLKFAATDLIHIVVADEADKEIVLAHARANKCLVSEAEACDRLCTFEEIRAGYRLLQHLNRRPIAQSQPFHGQRTLVSVGEALRMEWLPC